MSDEVLNETIPQEVVEQPAKAPKAEKKAPPPKSDAQIAIDRMAAMKERAERIETTHLAKTVGKLYRNKKPVRTGSVVR